MSDNALNAVVVVVAIFAVLHYFTLRTLITGRAIFERQADEDDRDTQVRRFKP